MIKNKKKYSIILNGEFPKNNQIINQIKSSDFLIATDGSANSLIDRNIIPDIIIGDLDSYKPEKDYNIEVLPIVDQSKTDFQKSLEWCVESDIKELTIFAISGKSEDHFLSNLYIINEFNDIIKWKAFTDFTTITPCIGEKKFESFEGQKVSLFTFEDESIINSKNLEYELNNYSLVPSAKAVRNISNGNNFTIDCSSYLFVFQSVKD